MIHLLSVLPTVTEQIKTADRIWLLTDYDGTLTPIMQRPELAKLPGNIRKSLLELVRITKLTIGVISGRSINDLKNLVDIKGIYYSGNHGMEIEGPGLKYNFPLSKDFEIVFHTLCRLLVKELSGIPGVLVEDKGLTFSVHYRQVDRHRVQEVRDIVFQTVGGLSAVKKLKITTGKEVLEIKSAVEWDKGKAISLLIRQIIKRKELNNILYIYIGDDLTDEDAFKEVNKHNNCITIFVGGNNEGSNARFYLRSPEEVSVFLYRLLELTGGKK